MSHRKQKGNWMSPPDTVNKTTDVDYKVRGPWEKRGNEELEEFERNLKAQSEYEYHSLFEAPEMSEARKKQLEEYQMNPPFNCGYNQIQEQERTAKKLAPGKNPVTRKPWEHGMLPADPPSFKIHEKPPTALWTVQPDPNKKASPMVSSGDPILDSLREQLFKHGASGIAGLARKFKIMDDDGSGTLNMYEFEKGMKECEIVDLSEKAIRHLFRYFDRDDSGVITYDEFLVGIRGVMNSRRRGLVQMAFKVMDKDGSGSIDLKDLKGVYDARGHPDVVQGRKTEEEILQQFIESFQVGKNKDAVVTLEEFESYYSNISASVDSDDYFELMIRNAWHISGGEGVYANTTNRRVLVTRPDGTQAVEEIKNDIGVGANDKEEMVRRLKAQGVSVGTINTNGATGMNNQYEAGSGYRTRVAPKAGEDAEQARLDREKVEQYRNAVTSGGRNYYPPGTFPRPGTSGSGVSAAATATATAPPTAVRAAPAPQRLSTFTGPTAAAAGGNNGVGRYNATSASDDRLNRSSGPAQNNSADVVKPVKLSEMLATVNLNDTGAKAPIKPVRLSDMLAATENVNLAQNTAANAATINSSNFNSTTQAGRRPSSSMYRR